MTTVVPTTAVLPPQAWALGWACLAVLDGTGDGWAPIHLATSVVELAALVAFTRTPYFHEQRAQARPAGPPLGSVLVLALLVGAIGGMVQGPGPSDAGVDLQLRL